MVGVPIPEQNRSCSGFLFVKYFLRISLCCHYTRNAAVFIGNRRRLLEIGTDHQTIRIVSNCWERGSFHIFASGAFLSLSYRLILQI